MRMKRTPLLVWRSATAAMVVMLGIATMTLTAPPAVAQSSFSSDGGQTYKKSPEGPTENNRSPAKLLPRVKPLMNRPTTRCFTSAMASTG